MTSKKATAQPGLLKKINRNLIMEIVFKKKQISRSELAKQTGLALPSIMRLVDGLIADGYLLDIGKGDSSGGRRPNLIAINKSFKYIIGVEIAVKTKVVLTDMSGQVIRTWSTIEMLDSTPEDILSITSHEIRKLLKDEDIKESHIAGIGIGTPGSHFKYLKDIDYSILRGWESIDVKAYFEKIFTCPVYVDNIARTRTLAELWFGHGNDYDDFIYVFVDQGVGCGIVSQGKIYEGHHHVAGEFGHHVIDYKGRPCYCGSRGCIEMYVSAGAIMKMFKSEGMVVQSFSDINKIDSKFKIQLLEQAAEVLTVGLANLINIHNPKAVILGGIVSCSDPILNYTKKHTKNHVFSYHAVDTPILKGAIDASGIGSVALVISKVFS